MNLKEICFRDKREILETEEMELVVKEYIFERSGRNVDVNIMKGLNPNSIVFIPQYQNQLVKLTAAFAHASAWFRDNKYK